MVAGPLPSPSPLAGKLFDENGAPLYAQGAMKDGRRYRYYVSRELVRGSGEQAQAGWRLSAPYARNDLPIRNPSSSHVHFSGSVLGLVLREQGQKTSHTLGSGGRPMDAVERLLHQVVARENHQDAPGRIYSLDCSARAELRPHTGEFKPQFASWLNVRE
jgi:hypothetical protein